MTSPNETPIEPTLIVDYGLGNLLSLQRALEHIGAEPRISNNPEDIATASRIILPGVGSYSEASKSLHEVGFAKEIVVAAGRGVPILGICLGMQVLFDEGHENGVSPGLGLMAGSVQRILGDDESSLPRTHIGWRDLDLVFGQEGVFPDFEFPKGPFYFVHSYGAKPTEPDVTMASVSYGEHDIPAIVQKDNILGVQFHPEKSGLQGLRLLAQFSTISK